MIETICVVLTCFYVVGIFYRNCVIQICEHKDKIGYTETLEYINNLKKEMDL